MKLLIISSFSAGKPPEISPEISCSSGIFCAVVKLFTHRDEKRWQLYGFVLSCFISGWWLSHPSEKYESLMFWLVVDLPTILKSHGVSSSMGRMTSHKWWKIIKKMKPPTSVLSQWFFAPESIVFFREIAMLKIDPALSTWRFFNPAPRPAPFTAVGPPRNVQSRLKRSRHRGNSRTQPLWSLRKSRSAALQKRTVWPWRRGKPPCFK